MSHVIATNLLEAHKKDWIRVIFQLRQTIHITVGIDGYAIELPAEWDNPQYFTTSTYIPENIPCDKYSE